MSEQRMDTDEGINNIRVNSAKGEYYNTDRLIGHDINNTIKVLLHRIDSQQELIEQQAKEIKKLSTCPDCGGSGVNEMCHDPYYAPPCACTIDWMSEAMKLSKQNSEQAKEIEKWKREALQQYPTPDAYEAACKALNKHRGIAEIAVKALEWYADQKTYRLGVSISMGSAFPQHEPIKYDKGELAKSTLDKIKGGNQP